MESGRDGKLRCILCTNQDVVDPGISLLFRSPSSINSLFAVIDPVKSIVKKTEALV